MSGKPTDVELAELTDEERAGLVEGEDEAAATEGEADAVASAAAEAEGTKGPESHESQTQPRDEAGRFARAEPEEPTPLLQPVDVNAAKAGLDAVKLRGEELLKQFDDGEITAREYADGLAKANEAASAFRWQMQKAELAGEIGAAQRVAMEKVWYDNCDAFIADHPELVSTDLRHAAFDMAVRKVNGSAETAKLPQHKQLEMARQLWAQELGIAEAAVNPLAARAARASPPERMVPPTLGRVPAAEMSETGGSEFSALERLSTTDPLRYELEMEKMSPVDRKRYLMTA